MTRAKRRDALQIIRQILDLQNSSRTDIRLSVGLNSKQVSRYLRHLVACGVLHEQPGERLGRYTYAMTPKGARLAQLLEELANTPGLEILFDGPP